MTLGAGKAEKGQLQGRRGLFLPLNDMTEMTITAEESSPKKARIERYIERWVVMRECRHGRAVRWRMKFQGGAEKRESRSRH